MEKIIKRQTYVIWLICIIPIVLIALAICLYTFRPVDTAISIDGLNSALQGEYILIKTDGDYYMIDGSEELPPLLQIDTWGKTNLSDNKVVIATLHFAEQYELYLYDDGTVSAYNGYAPIGRKDEIAYAVSADAISDTIEYILNNGTELELGDGHISSSTFLK